MSRIVVPSLVRVPRPITGRARRPQNLDRIVFASGPRTRAEREFLESLRDLVNGVAKHMELQVDLIAVMPLALGYRFHCSETSGLRNEFSFTVSSTEMIATMEENPGDDRTFLEKVAVLAITEIERVRRADLARD
jgi:hypothetical protein